MERQTDTPHELQRAGEELRAAARERLSELERGERHATAARLLPRATRFAEPTLAAQLGLPHRIERLKAIELETERLLARLAEAYEEEREAAAHEPERFGRRWTQRLERTSFIEVNELIEIHNEWFPMEAHLRWDRDLDDYRAPFGIPWRKRVLDVDWALEHFPAELPSDEPGD